VGIGLETADLLGKGGSHWGIWVAFESDCPAENVMANGSVTFMAIEGRKFSI